MAVLRFEDFTGACDAVIFSELYPSMIDRVEADKICFITCEVDRRREEPSLTVFELVELSDARHTLSKKVTLGLSEEDDLEMVLPAVHRVLRQNPGSLPVFFEYKTRDLGDVLIQAGDGFKVKVTPDLLGELEKLLGTERLRLN
jgi:DNA polymerase-3 subunit alpha